MSHGAAIRPAGFTHARRSIILLSMAEAQIPSLLAHSPEKAPPQRWWSTFLPAILAIMGILLAHACAREGSRMHRRLEEATLRQRSAYWHVKLNQARMQGNGHTALIRRQLKTAEHAKLPSFSRPGREFTQWDGQRYAQIVKHGYTFPTTYDPKTNRLHLETVSWFPLYPMLALAVHDFTHWSVHKSLTLVSDLCVLMAAVIMFAFARRHFYNRMPWEEVDASSWHIARRWDLFSNDTAALWSVVFLLFGPASIFLYVNYAESLFVLLIALFLMAIQSRYWLRAAGVAAVASACSPQGALLAPVLALTYLLRTDLPAAPRLLRCALWGALSLVGLGAYMTFLALRFGHPLAFLHAQAAWHSGINIYTLSYGLNPVHPLSNFFYYAMLRPVDFPRLWEATCVVVPPLALLLLGARFLSFEAEMLGWLFWGVPYFANCLAGSSPSNGHWMSMGRYMQVVIPLQLIAGSVIIRFRWLGPLLLAFSAVAFALLALRYGAGAWVG